MLQQPFTGAIISTFSAPFKHHVCKSLFFRQNFFICSTPIYDTVLKNTVLRNTLLKKTLLKNALPTNVVSEKQFCIFFSDQSLTLKPQTMKQTPSTIEWNIKELEKYFNRAKLPTSPLKLSPTVHIGNVRAYIDYHMDILKANFQRPTYEPYLRRMQELKKYIESNQSAVSLSGKSVHQPKSNRNV